MSISSEATPSAPLLALYDGDAGSRADTARRSEVRFC